MLIRSRYYDEGDPANPATDDPAIDPQKDPASDPDLASPDKGKTDDPAKDKPKPDDGVDYKKLYEEKDNQFKEFQRGINSKLEELAEIKRREKESQTQKEQDDEITQIDSQIAEIDKQIPYYEQNNVDTTALKASRMTLVNDRKDALRRRQNEAAQRVLRDFKSDHPDFKDWDGLDHIMAEAQKNGDYISPHTAYRIWSDRMELKRAKESAAINNENAKLGKNATGLDGKPAPANPEKTFSDSILENTWGIK